MDLDFVIFPTNSYGLPCRAYLYQALKEVLSQNVDVIQEQRARLVLSQSAVQKLDNVLFDDVQTVFIVQVHALNHTHLDGFDALCPLLEVAAVCYSQKSAESSLLTLRSISVTPFAAHCRRKSPVKVSFEQEIE